MLAAPPTHVDKSAGHRDALAARASVLLLVAGCTLAIVPLSGARFADHTGVKHAFLALAVGCAAMALRSRPIRLTGFELGLGALVALSLLALPTTHDPAAALGGLSGIVAVAVCSAALRSELARGRLSTAWVLDVMLATGTAVALIAIGEALGARLPWAAVARPESTVGGRNYVAQLLVLLLPLAVVRAHHAGGKWRLAGALVMAAVLVVCRCRAAWLAFGAAGLVFAVMLYRHRHGSELGRARRVALALLIGAAVGATIPWPGLAFSAPLSDSAARVLEYESGSGRVRIEQHEVGARAFASRPLLGAGAGGWEDAASEHAHAVGKHTHARRMSRSPNSDWLRLLVEHGLLGVLAVSAAALFLLAALRRMVMAGDRLLAIALLASFAAVAVASCFDALLIRPEILALCSVMAALALQREPGWLVAPAPLVVGVALTAGWIGALQASSMGLTTLSRQEPDRAELWERRAVSVFPRADVTAVLAQRLSRQDRCEQAARFFREEHRAAPHHWATALAVARCFQRRGRAGQEQARYHAAIAKSVESHIVVARR